MSTIADCMKRRVVSVPSATTIQEAARIIASRRVGTLPVIDDQGMLTGIVRLQDVLSVFMPDFVSLMQHIDFVHDFGVLEHLEPLAVQHLAGRTVADLMQPAIAVEQTCGLLRGFATLVKHDIYDLPVVDADGRLVGIASRVDVAVAFLAAWTRQEQ